MLDQLKALPEQVRTLLGAVTVVAVVAVVVSIYQYSSHQSAETEWDQEKSGLSQRIEGLETDNAALKADVDQKAATIGQLETANADLIKKHGALQTIEAEAVASKDKLLGLTSKITQSESQLKFVGLRLATNQASLMAAINKRKKAAQDAESLKANQVRLVALENEVHALERQLQMLGQRQAAGQLGLRRILNRRDQILNVTEQLEAKRATLEPLAEQADVRNRELKSLAQRVAANQVSLSSTLKRQAQANEALGELRVKSDYLAGVVAESDIKKRQLKDLALRLSTTQASLKRSLDQRQLVAEESQAMRSKLAGVERKLSSLQQELASWDGKIQALRDLVGEAEGQLGEPLIY